MAIRDIHHNAVVAHLGRTGDREESRASGQPDHVSLGEGAAAQIVAVQAAAPFAALELGHRLVIGLLERLGSGLLQLGLGGGKEGIF